MAQNLLSQFSDLPLGFGGAALSGEGGGYGFGTMDKKTALSLLDEAFELGVRLYDTAPIYGFGVSEERLGEAFRNKRDQVFLVSKSGVSWHSTKRVDMTNDPHTTRKMLESSLKRLKTDYIDHYMIHWPDQRVDIRRPMEVLARALDRGEIRSIGLCNTHREDLLAAQEIAPIQACQSQLNLFERGVTEDLLPLLKVQNIGFMSWGTLDKGILTGRVTAERKFEAEDCRSWAPWWKAIDFEARYRILDRLRPWMKDNEMDGLALALGFNLATEGVDVVLAGPKSSAQLQGLVKNLKPLSEQHYREVLEILESC